MNIYLPSDTRISDIVDVMGILTGNAKHKEPLSGDGNGGRREYWHGFLTDGKLVTV
jgi:hypothetical protein